MTTAVDIDHTPLKAGDTVECVERSRWPSDHPQQVGERYTVQAVVSHGLILAGQEAEVLAERFRLVTETQPNGLPDATADGYDWPALAPDDTDSPTSTSVLLEAQRAVYGDRQADYGHPREDFTRQAILWTGLLQHKLADGEYIEAEDIARCMVAVKLARDVHSPKRDNRVDGAGYFLTLDRLATGK